jgi:nitroimidazol reductase NimA-like FMN-containing flavoprotein (pyridoxamine 5'-phosphate oxidase superfamily)
MSETSQPVSVLPESECWKLLSNVALGRLVTTVDGQPEIFPVNFAVQQRTILFRTAEGTKLMSAAINDGVLFEVDQHDLAGVGASSSRAPLGCFGLTKSSTRRTAPACFRGRHRRSSTSCEFVH